MASRSFQCDSRLFFWLLRCSDGPIRTASLPAMLEYIGLTSAPTMFFRFWNQRCFRFILFMLHSSNLFRVHVASCFSTSFQSSNNCCVSCKETRASSSNLTSSNDFSALTCSLSFLISFLRSFLSSLQLFQFLFVHHFLLSISSVASLLADLFHRCAHSSKQSKLRLDLCLRPRIPKLLPCLPLFLPVAL